MMPLRSRVLLLALLASLAGCGTTVPVGAARTDALTGDGLGGSNAASSDGVDVDAATGEASSGLGTSGSAGSSDSAPEQTGAQSPPAAAGARGSVTTTGTGTGSTLGKSRPQTGTDRSPVRVGVLYLDGADAAASNLGISGLSTGDAWAQAKAVTAHLNASGGLAGRRIDLRKGRMDAASAVSDPEQTYAAACASLTQDEKVTYVVSYVNLTAARLACYAKRKVTVLDDQSAVVDSAGTTYSHTFAGPGELALGRTGQELVDGLWRTGWLTGSSKVGILVPDTPDGAESETRYLVPALAAHGLKAVTFRATGASSANSTVLRFRSAGVDRVIPLGQSPLFVMNAAESQGYRPFYAMNSGFGPGALLETAAPKAQLKGAAGIGWSKFLDIGAGTRPPASSPNETLCFDLMRKAGEQSTSATTQAFQLSLCNVLMFLKAGADRFGVTPDLLDTIATRGLVFPPADTYAITMRPRRADGVAAYRDVVFEDACSCFQYVGGEHATR